VVRPSSTAPTKTRAPTTALSPTSSTPTKLARTIAEAITLLRSCNGRAVGAPTTSPPIRATPQIATKTVQDTQITNAEIPTRAFMGISRWTSLRLAQLVVDRVVRQAVLLPLPLRGLVHPLHRVLRVMRGRLRQPLSRLLQQRQSPSHPRNLHRLLPLPRLLQL